MNLKHIISKIVKRFQPEKIILLGSYPFNKKNFDIDLMIVMNSNELPHKRPVEIRKLLRNISLPKDIIVKTPEEFEKFKDIVGTVIYLAHHQGKILYEKG